MAVRLENYMFRSDIGTYKVINELISNGHVKVNGVVETDNNYKVDAASDFVDVDGKLLNYRKYVYMFANKPEGISNKLNDRESKSIMDILPDWCVRRKLEIVSIPDKNMSGITLLTDDFGYIHHFNHFKKQAEFVYHIQTNRAVTIKHVEAFSSGMRLKHYTGPMATLSKTDSYYKDEYAARVSSKELLFKDIKKMLAVLHVGILSVELIAIGNLVLPYELEQGMWRELTGDEMALLGITNPYA